MKPIYALVISAVLVAGSGCATRSVELSAKGYKKRNAQTNTLEQISPQPAYNALLPFALAFDVATSPVQVPVILYIMLSP